MAQDFFLPPDEAKTFGDIDFMRRKQSTRKTYPKGKRATEVVQASSLEMKVTPEGAQPQSSFSNSSQASTPAQSSTPVTPNRRPSSNTGSLDFGAMARKMGRK
ncbi:hypothetical protein [Roseofilum casamattae]|uniref:Uncharacterized protein n=1 Tax=Roseofilum casamattae BLCC-M143 TaxID=3022442 RepID=A0ABT7BVU6_9CYAN|nr:hypothetical protein [Roseofilum casamattae]MDJ1183301.1 hypothetical protein [Roseofilum casamattae BLCC-M143]